MIVMKDIFLKLKYLENLYSLHNDLPFLPERMKIEKVEELRIMQFLNNHGKCEKTDIKFVTTETRRNYLVSEPNSYKKIFWIFIIYRNEKNINIHE